MADMVSSHNAARCREAKKNDKSSFEGKIMNIHTIDGRLIGRVSLRTDAEFDRCGLCEVSTGLTLEYIPYEDIVSVSVLPSTFVIKDEE